MTDQTKLSAIGTGSILPAGTLPTVSLDGATEISVVIIEFANQDGLDMVKVQYPDGWVKWHQAISVEDLLGKVTNQLRGRYAVTTFEFDGIPTDMKPDQTINLTGVEYGT